MKVNEDSGWSDLTQLFLYLQNSAAFSYLLERKAGCLILDGVDGFKWLNSWVLEKVFIFFKPHHTVILSVYLLVGISSGWFLLALTSF